MLTQKRESVWLSLCTSFLLLASVSARWSLELKQVHVVTRHGVALQMNDEEVLSHWGQKQFFDLGQWLQKRYEDTGNFDMYSPTRVHLQSSNFDRTITSANSLALGLFDQKARDPMNETLISVLPANIPVFSNADKNDVTIRAYDKCPAGLDLEALYESQDFIYLQLENAALLKRLGQIPEFASHVDYLGKIPLKNVWNVYDAIYVAKAECRLDMDTTGCMMAGPSLPTVLTDSEWEALQKLAHKAELLKFGTNRARFVGINLLNEIIDYMSDRSLGSGFYLYSGHYPTLLGVFAAIGGYTDESEVIPDYSSALVFEMYRDRISGLKRMKVFYKAGGAENATQLSLRKMCVSLTTDGGCPLGAIAPKITLYSLNEWCTDCGNDSADVCLQQDLQSSEQGLSQPAAIGVGFLIGLVVAFVLVTITICAMRNSKETIEPPESGPESPREDNVTIASSASYA